MNHMNGLEGEKHKQPFVSMFAQMINLEVPFEVLLQPNTHKFGRWNERYWFGQAYLNSLAAGRDQFQLVISDHSKSSRSACTLLPSLHRRFSARVRLPIYFQQEVIELLAASLMIIWRVIGPNSVPCGTPAVSMA